MKLYKIISLPNKEALNISEYEYTNKKTFNLNADAIPIRNTPLSEKEQKQQKVIQSYGNIKRKQTQFILFPEHMFLSKMGELENDQDDPIIHQHEIIPNLFLGDFASFKTAVKENPNKIDLAVRVNHEQFKFKPLTNIKTLELGSDVQDDNSAEAWHKLSAKFGDIFKEIDEALSQNKRVLVSCGMGVSRSATTVMAYLMYRFKLTFKQAFNFVYQKRSTVRPRENFVDGLKVYERRLFPDRKKKT